MPTNKQIEDGAKALCKHWGEHWDCQCVEKKDICDCGDAIAHERVDRYDDQMSRKEYLDAAKTVLEATT